jgi:uncharacterized repeat protein (TIGR01451 family)
MTVLATRGLKHMRNTKLLLAAAASVLAVASAAPAFAEGIVAGQQVNNTATLTYATGGVQQPNAITSNQASFLVDRKINLTVAEVGGTATQTVGGALTQVTRFTVSNTSNAKIDILLSAVNQVGGAAPFGGTDSFDVTNIRYAIDTNNDGLYTAGTDTLVTFLDEVNPDTTTNLLVLADIPAGTPNAGVAAIILTGTSAESGAVGTAGAATVETAGVDSPTAVDTVWADGAGFNDIARDGKFSSRDQYTIVSAVVTLVKQANVISDPSNGTTNPKAIPGAVIEYCLIATNTGTVAASNVVFNDPYPNTQVAFVPGSNYVGGLTTPQGAGVTCDQTTTNGGVAGNSANTANVFTATLADLPAGASRTARFRVTVR